MYDYTRFYLNLQLFITVIIFRVLRHKCSTSEGYIKNQYHGLRNQFFCSSKIFIRSRKIGFFIRLFGIDAQRIAT